MEAIEAVEGIQVTLLTNTINKCKVTHLISTYQDMSVSHSSHSSRLPFLHTSHSYQVGSFRFISVLLLAYLSETQDHSKCCLKSGSFWKA